MSKKNIIVTGGFGFLGTNIAIDQIRRGNNVFVLDNLSKERGLDQNKDLLLKNGANFSYCDIRNWNDVKTYFKNTNFDVVIHCAAQVAFKRSVENPRADFEINALGTFNLLEAFRIFSPDSIFISTSTNQVYGPMNNLKIKEMETRYVWMDEPYRTYGIAETQNLDFLSPYGCSKGAADQYSLDYARIYGLKVCVIRLSGIYGINQYSYEDHGWISFMAEMIKKNKEFNRYGNGKQVRDILYIDDIVKLYNIVIEKIELAKGEAFNIGGGMSNSISVLELLKELEEITGYKQKSILNPDRTGDKLIYISDIRKAEKILNWQPKISIEDGLTKLIDWI